MRKYYRKKQGCGVYLLIGFIALIIIGTIVSFIKENAKTILIIGGVILSIIIIILIIKFTKKKKFKKNNYENRNYNNYNNYNNSYNLEQKQEENTPKYEVKDNLITYTESKFFKTLQDLYAQDYIVQPQVNLATIINKTDNAKYRSELFRNIDFGIFTKDYKPLILIELNDSSHNQYERRERDHKVRAICEEAKIPLITFWTSKPNEEWYIKKQLEQYLRN